MEERETEAQQTINIYNEQQFIFKITNKITFRTLATNEVENEVYCSNSQNNISFLLYFITNFTPSSVNHGFKNCRILISTKNNHNYQIH